MRDYVTVCRGCCCGTVKKHPDFDHEHQLARLRELAAASGGRLSVRTADCLDACESSNVLVVKPRGQQPVWLGFALDDGVVDDVASWLDAGGPLPERLALNRVSPPKPAKKAKKK
ncbi:MULTISPECIES: (2Fe-2S) ferredoxin domain-containing protein [Actinosynnema]|uniref:(2Fe-2S) ferredoxin domain-containing protein n=1 Tax=Actinosynnema TaxID=40566 RepID=UPI0020A2F26E|nr:(2Fe-2S) ferredoxin domain-containing protein [Actinosynnema pretiosum]MCP2093032.1 (2Fe-2S) ferredoxin [Actinosynnema pretiosum]